MSVTDELFRIKNTYMDMLMKIQFTNYRRIDDVLMLTKIVFLKILFLMT